ncbi:IS3 family transposase, partial [Bacillus carboniphilus]|uniref:IS3 family transposase n=1 Tax=Bacillus carboniphilus TaxID=86663 RepID=UPI0031CDFC87
SKQESFAFIKAFEEEYPVTKLVEITSMSEAGKVSKSGYYKWRATCHLQSAQDQKDEELYYYILQIFHKHKGTYGRKRIYLELKNKHQMIVNEKRIARVMRKYGLRCQIRRRRFRNRNQPHGTVPNLLNRNFKALKPGKKLAIDITYVEAKEKNRKWLYACVIKDLYNGEVVAYSIGKNQSKTLVYRTLLELKKRGFEKGAILHSDQGSQFTNPGYMKRVLKMGLTQSMSRRGNCWDNACVENFFSHLKTEMYCFSTPKSAIEVQKAVEDYIYYYNNERLQNKLEMSPVEYREQKAA